MSVWATNNHTSQLVFNKLRTFSVKLKKQNVKSIAYLYLNKLGVRKVSSFPFPDFFYLLQISMNAVLTIVRDSGCFFMFSFETDSWTEKLIHLRMANA